MVWIKILNKKNVISQTITMTETGGTRLKVRPRKPGGTGVKKNMKSSGITIITINIENKI